MNAGEGGPIRVILEWLMANQSCNESPNLSGIFWNLLLCDVLSHLSMVSVQKIAGIAAVHDHGCR